MTEDATTVFSYISTINKKVGKYPQDDLDLFNSIYSQFVVNMAYCRYADTILIVEKLAMMTNITNLQHFEYLYNNITKSNKRFAKWNKVDVDSNIDVIMVAYKYSYEKAKSVVDLFTDDAIEKLKLSYLNIGGVER